MIKLIYLSNLRLPTEKAYGLQITKMCEAFVGAGVDVELVYPYRKNPIKADIFDYYSIKKIFKIKKIPSLDFYLFGAFDKITVGLKSFISAVVLVFYVLFQRSDVIYSRDELVLFLISFFKKNIVFETHRYSPKRNFFYGRFKNLGIKIVVISEAIKKEFLKFGFNEKNILIAHDGVDLKEFDLSIGKEEARKKIGLPLDKKIAMYTGHLFEWKGASVLLETARLVRDVGVVRDVRNEEYNSNKRSDPTSEAIQLDQPLFVFVGGTEYDIKSFKEKAEELDNVLILGHKPHQDIPVYLKAADVLILPNSAKEKISSYTSPLKLFEYMASSRPIVASDLPPIREVLNENNSILVKPDDLEALAEGIKLVLANAELAERISNQALKDVQSYTWQKRASAITDFLCFKN